VTTGGGGEATGTSGTGGSGWTGAGSVDAGMDAAAPIKLPPLDATPPANAPAICEGGGPPKAYLLAQDATVFQFDPSTLALHSLGVLKCPSSAEPWTFTVSQDGSAYVLFEDWNLYRVDLSTMQCSTTSYASGQLGFSGQEAIALAPSEKRLYVYGNASTPALAVADVKDFLLFRLGAGQPAAPFPVDMKVDAYNRMYGLGNTGALTQFDPSTGDVMAQDQTGFDGTTGGWALMAYEDSLYFFGGSYGGVTRYDVATKTMTPIGQVNQTIVGASAVPCTSAPSSDDGGADGGPDAGAPPASPFSPGDSWIGTYVCQQGLTNLAVVIESVNGDAVNARFDFNWVQGNAAGSFELTGTFDPATGHAVFTPGAWVSQPASTWETVGLDGFVNESGNAFAGSISHSGCGAFSVQR
jgi:hypothetical protein